MPHLTKTWQLTCILHPWRYLRRALNNTNAAKNEYFFICAPWITLEVLEVVMIILGVNFPILVQTQNNTETSLNEFRYPRFTYMNKPSCDMATILYVQKIFFRTLNHFECLAFCQGLRILDEYSINNANTTRKFQVESIVVVVYR